MKFLKSTLLTGLYIILPVLLLWIGLREIGGVLYEMADPIAEFFPADYFDEVKLPGIIAGLLITMAAFLLGIFAKIPPVAALGNAFETKVLYRVPMYKMLKMISSALIGIEASGVFPAILKSEGGGGDPCYVMERHESGMATVLLPWSPASFAGSIKVVPQSQLEILDCSIDEYSRSISFMGVGVADCLAQRSNDKS